jgi:heme-degrading monooxygenase HmoA
MACSGMGDSCWRRRRDAHKAEYSGRRQENPERVFGPGGRKCSIPRYGHDPADVEGRSTAEKTGEYVQHATRKVFPALRMIEGHRGAYLLRRAVDGAIELVVLTLWESTAAVRKFAGEEPEEAVVEPEARAILTAFDGSVTHFEVVQRTEGTAK